MSYLKIEELSMKNIRCFDSLDVEFKERTNVITGENGSGKSTILTAIGFGLFGSSYLTGLKMETNDMVQRGYGEGQIKLTFRTDKGLFESRHKIYSGTKSNEWIVRDKTKSKTLTKTISSSKEFISSRIGNNVDHNIYKNALCSPQGQLSRLLELEDYKRKEQIRKILNLDQYDITASHIGKVIDKINNEVTLITSKKEMMSELVEDPKILEEEKIRIEEEIKSRRVKLNTISSNIEVIKRNLADQEKIETQVEIDTNQHDYISDGLKSVVQDINTSQNNLDEWIHDINIDIQDLKSAEENYDECKKIKEINDENLGLVKSRLRDHNNLILDLEAEKNKLIEKIKQSDEVRKVQSEFNKKYNEKSIKMDLNEYQLLLNTAEETRKRIIENLNELAQKINSLKTDTESTQNNIDNLNEESITTFQVEPHELTNIKSELDSSKSNSKLELKSIDEEIDRKLLDIGEIEAQIKLSEQTISLLSEKIVDKSCPTCFRDFDATGHEQLINRHIVLVENNKEIKKSHEGVLRENELRIKELNTHINQIIKKENKLAVLLDRFNHLEDWLSRVAKNRFETGDLENKKLEFESKIGEFSEAKIEELKLKVQKFKELIDNHDDIEKRLTIIETQIESHNNSIKTVNSKLKNFENLNDLELEKQLKSKIDQSTILIDKLDLIKQEFGKRKLLDKRHKDLESEIKILRDRLQENVNKFSAKRLEELKQSINDLNKASGSNKTILNDLTIEKLPKIVDDLTKAKDRQIQAEKIDNELNYYNDIKPKFEKMRSVMKTLPDKIISRISNKVSNQITSMLRRMLPDRGYDKAIFNGDGSIDLVSKGEIVDRSSLSHGERTVVSVALRFALADNVAPLQFLVLDEPTNYLDTRRIREFVEIIDRDDLFSAGSGQLLLVTHREEFDRNASNSIHIKVNQDGTRSIVQTNS